MCVFLGLLWVRQFVTWLRQALKPYEIPTQKHERRDALIKIEEQQKQLLARYAMLQAQMHSFEAHCQTEIKAMSRMVLSIARNFGKIKGDSDPPV